ncbi:hypothetical protein [Paraferrimonas sp. SM1919]|uniref:hypothetical protein n=1 Tax=Paraferrimonas sp. SM1919 TaxID=2662263 RepID=UPI0013D3379B|nr:hypothetical protein [Paraferrimonas sp. SM1919]
MKIIAILISLLTLCGCQQQLDIERLQLITSWSESGKVELYQGKASLPAAANSSSKIIFKIQQQLDTDLNQDGLMDKIIILTVDTVGSGLFYYLYPVINDNTQAIAKEGVLIGDRVIIKNLSHHSNIITVQYLKHTVEQSYSEHPQFESELKWQWQQELVAIPTETP